MKPSQANEHQIRCIYTGGFHAAIEKGLFAYEIITKSEPKYFWFRFFFDICGWTEVINYNWNPMKVIKFGGTSVGSVENVKKIDEIVF